MNNAELLKEQLQGLRDEIANTLKDLSDAQVNWRPNDKANSIGFVLWHALRVWDLDYARTGAGSEMYFSGGWEDRFGFSVAGWGPGGRANGNSFTPEQVAAMPMRGAALQAYLDALWARSAAYLAQVGDGELARQFPHPHRPDTLTTAARILSHTLSHAYMHSGEAQYVRGLM